ncbi:hypothetical protein AB0O34_02765 [Sphaerisporangium sp. NPDC088356]|uniref:hypothetical protein n=1 Tax=Sphaerisporangium sp. NPDC088356 TaxID=3154871 RepID=UPI003427AA09
MAARLRQAGLTEDDSAALLGLSDLVVASTDAAALTTAGGNARQSHCFGSMVEFQLNWKFQKSMKILIRRAVIL